MAEGAHVTSIEAIESFRASLIVYLSKTRPLLDDACDDVFRTREWLDNDRRVHWENQVRHRTRKLEQAEQALFSARFANLRGPPAVELLAMERAKRALAEAEEKLKSAKRWSRDFEHHSQPLVKQLEQLRTVLASEMPRAASYLAEVIKRLDLYAGTSPPSTGTSAASTELNPPKEDSLGEQAALPPGETGPDHPSRGEQT